MAAKDGLGFWYRVRWAVDYVLLSVIGPASLGPGQDPRERMRAERAARVRRAAEEQGRS